MSQNNKITRLQRQYDHQVQLSFVIGVFKAEQVDFLSYV